MSGANTAVMLANLASSVLGLLQFAQSMQANIAVLQQAQAAGRDVTPEEMEAAKASAQASLNDLQSQLDSMP